MPASATTILLDIEWNMKFGAGFGGTGSTREPARWIARYDGRLFAVERDGVRRRVGRVTARRCLLREASPFLVLDADMELAAYGALFSRSGRFRERVSHGPGDLLVLDRLGLVPDYRGRGLGLAVIREVTRQLGPGCAAVALIPSPMSYEHVTGEFTRIRDDAAARKLEEHYRRLGFTKLGTVMHFDLSRSLDPHAEARRRPAPARTFRRNNQVVV